MTSFWLLPNGYSSGCILENISAAFDINSPIFKEYSLHILSLIKHPPDFPLITLINFTDFIWPILVGICYPWGVFSSLKCHSTFQLFTILWLLIFSRQKPKNLLFEPPLLLQWGRQPRFCPSDSILRDYNWKFSEHEEVGIWGIHFLVSVMAEGSNSVLAEWQTCWFWFSRIICMNCKSSGDSRTCVNFSISLEMPHPIHRGLYHCSCLVPGLNTWTRYYKLLKIFQ